MTRIATIKVDSCNFCPFQEESGGLAGSADWCEHPKFRNPRQIVDRDCDKDFPPWCPLEPLRPKK